jgi:membrane protease YdiL (CAAX protease family)
MMASHVALDHVLFAAIAIVSPLVDLWLYPMLVRASAAGVPGVRARAYVVNLLTAWGLTACVIGLWAARGRPWSALRLGFATPLRLGAGLALAVAFLVLLLVQRRALVARPDRLARLASKLSNAEALLPHTPGELRGFAAVSITAGICEELLFRGFLMWYFAGWGVVAAVVVSSLFFGFAHIYLGVPHVPRTAILGLVFALIVVAAGSLWPAIIIHAAIDLNSGDLGYRALSGAKAQN